MSSNRHGPASSLAYLCFALGAGCAAAPTPWIEDGVRLGEIRTTEVDGKQRLAYHDLENHLVRIEYRTAAGSLDPARPAEHREYDETGRMWHVYFTNGNGERTPGPDGFAARRTNVENVAGVRLTHIEHFDAGDRPMTLAGGYHRETLARHGGRLRHRRFFDAEGRRVAADMGKWSGVHEVRYAYLRGVTPIVMEMLVDSEGEPMHKRKISGSTEVIRRDLYGQYGTYYGTEVIRR